MNIPRYDYVEVPISREEAQHNRDNEIAALQAEIERIKAEPLPTTEGRFVRSDRPDAAFEEVIVEHPIFPLITTPEISRKLMEDSE